MSFSVSKDTKGNWDCDLLNLFGSDTKRARRASDPSILSSHESLNIPGQVSEVSQQVFGSLQSVAILNSGNKQDLSEPHPVNERMAKEISAISSALVIDEDELLLEESKKVESLINKILSTGLDRPFSAECVDEFLTAYEKIRVEEDKLREKKLIECAFKFLSQYAYPDNQNSKTLITNVLDFAFFEQEGTLSTSANKETQSMTFLIDVFMGKKLWVDAFLHFFDALQEKELLNKYKVLLSILLEKADEEYEKKLQEQNGAVSDEFIERDINGEKVLGADNNEVNKMNAARDLWARFERTQECQHNDN